MNKKELTEADIRRQLEVQLAASRATAAKLMQAVVAELTASAPTRHADSSTARRLQPQEQAYAG